MSRSDALAEQVLAETLVAHGRSRRWVGARLGNRRAATVARVAPTRRRGKAPAWTASEDDYLRANLGRQSEAEIAIALGRSETAVRLRWKRDLQLPAPSRNPDWVTAEQIAEGLGVDTKLIDRLIDEGRLAGWRLPTRRTMRVALRITVLQWLVNPDHGIYFRPERVNRGPRRSKRCYDFAFWAKAKRLVELARRRWDDEWLSAGQAARLRGVSGAAINKAVRDGRLPGIKWGNWRFRRSAVMRPELVFFTGKGTATSVHYTDAADAFLLLARAVGLPWSAIGRLMAWPGSRCEYRFATLMRTGAIRRLSRNWDLKIACNTRKRVLFADWKRYRHRFPQLARAMQRFRVGVPVLDARDLSAVRGVLRTWAAWFARTSAQRALARRLANGSMTTLHTLRETWGELRVFCANPFRRSPI